MDEQRFIVPIDDHSDVLVFPIGKFFRDGQKRELTQEQARQMVQNYLDNVLERKDNLLPVNAEHVRENGRIAYLKNLYQDPDGNVRGVIDGDLSKFDYLSPEVTWEWSHPGTGENHGPVILGAGATNYPFFLGKMALNSQLWLGNEWWTTTDSIEHSDSNGTITTEEVQKIIDAYATERDKLNAAREARARRYGIGVKDGGNLTPPSDYPQSEGEYGDPVNYRYPADSPRARAAITRFNDSGNRSKGGYSSEEWSIIGRRLARLVGRHIDAEYQYRDGRIVRKESNMSEEVETQESGTDTVTTQEVQTSTNEATTVTPPAEDYAEKYELMAEQFAQMQAQLEATQAKNQELAEKYADSEKQRRLMHFSDVATSLAVAVEPEQFAEDLYQIEQVNAELAERVIERFRAASEATRQSSVFQQFSSAEEPTSGDPWLNKVKAVQKEHFNDLDPAVGWVEAEKRAAREFPQMARDYALRNRGG